MGGHAPVHSAIVVSSSHVVIPATAGIQARIDKNGQSGYLTREITHTMGLLWVGKGRLPFSHFYC